MADVNRPGTSFHMPIAPKGAVQSADVQWLHCVVIHRPSTHGLSNPMLKKDRPQEGATRRTVER
jgi:hypothetical protein